MAESVQIPVAPLEDAAELQLDIAGMTCASCVLHVEKALQKVPGVNQADVNLTLEKARVRFNPAQVDTDDLVRAVSHAGYQVRAEHRVFALAGLEEAPVRDRTERVVRAVHGGGKVEDRPAAMPQQADV